MAIRNFPMPGPTGSGPIRSKLLQPSTPVGVPRNLHQKELKTGQPLDRNPNKPGLGWGGAKPKPQPIVKAPVGSVRPQPPLFQPQPYPGTPKNSVSDMAKKVADAIGSRTSGDKRLKPNPIGSPGSNVRKAKAMEAKKRRQDMLVQKLKKSEGSISPKQKSRLQEAAKARKSRSIRSGRNPGKHKGWSKAQDRAKFFKTDAFN